MKDLVCVSKKNGARVVIDAKKSIDRDTMKLLIQVEKTQQQQNRKQYRKG